MESRMENSCRCPSGELIPCQPHERNRKENCPYLCRPRDLQVQKGDVISMNPDTKIWSERIGQSPVEYYTAAGLGDLLFEVDEIYRTRDYTQARVFDGATKKTVWVNLWHRYDETGGAQRAIVIWRA